MAAAATRRIESQPISAVAIVGDEIDSVDDPCETRARARSALARAREQLSRRLLGEIWTQSAALDVGIWGRAVTDVEADRTLREAAERGVIYIDPTPAADETGGERRGGLRALLRRAIGVGA